MEMDLPFSALESQDNTFKAAICVRGVSYCSSQLDRPHHSVAGNGGDLQLGDHQTVPTLISTREKGRQISTKISTQKERPPRYIHQSIPLPRYPVISVIVESSNGGDLYQGGDQSVSTKISTRRPFAATDCHQLCLPNLGVALTLWLRN